MLADMATAVEASRALYLAAARRKDAGQEFGRQAAMAKLLASDTAMAGVTIDAGTGPWRLRVRWRTSRPSATCVRPRSCRSVEGTTRSSGWSSPGRLPGADQP